MSELPFNTCEEYVLALLQDAQEQNKVLRKEIERLTISDSMLNLLKNYIVMDPATNTLTCNVALPSGPVASAFASTFSNRPEEKDVPSKPEKIIPKSPNADKKNRKKVIPMKGQKAITNNDQVNSQLPSLEKTPVEQELSEDTYKRHPDSEPILDNGYEEI